MCKHVPDMCLTCACMCLSMYFDAINAKNASITEVFYPHMNHAQSSTPTYTHTHTRIHTHHPVVALKMIEVEWQSGYRLKITFPEFSNCQG